MKLVRVRSEDFTGVRRGSMKGKWEGKEAVLMRASSHNRRFAGSGPLARPPSELPCVLRVRCTRRVDYDISE